MAVADAADNLLDTGDWTFEGKGYSEELSADSERSGRHDMLVGRRNDCVPSRRGAGLWSRAPQGDVARMRHGEGSGTGQRDNLLGRKGNQQRE